MRKRRGETKQQRAERKLGEDYPKGAGRNVTKLGRSKYIPAGKRKNVERTNR